MMLLVSFFTLNPGLQATDLTKQVDAVYQRASATGFSGSVYVVCGDGRVLSKGYGHADPKAKLPVTPKTIFSVGSVTKWFTGLAILRLEQDRRLSLDAPIATYLDGVPKDKQKVSIRHLLSHSAGLGEYVDEEGEGGDFAEIDKQEAVRRALTKKLRFAPGTKAEYSNVGYTLLAAIVEKVTRQPFEAYVRQTVFQKAGMDRSGFLGEQTWPANEFAIGQGRKTRGTQNSSYYWGKATWSLTGAGGIVSTSEDLGRAVLALTGGKILDATHRRKMFAPLFEKEGCGWIVGKTSTGAPFCNVGGGDDFGFQAAILYLPESGKLVISCSNSDTPRLMRDANLEVLKLIQ